jgi:hypothetical protein
MSADGEKQTKNPARTHASRAKIIEHDHQIALQIEKEGRGGE